MGRGKVKYRDVVKKDKSSYNKKGKKGFRPRKTYSLYKNDKKRNNQKDDTMKSLTPTISELKLRKNPQ